MFKKITNIGDCGIVCDFGSEVNQEINTNVIKFFYYFKDQIAQGKLKGILNANPTIE